MTSTRSFHPTILGSLSILGLMAGCATIPNSSYGDDDGDSTPKNGAAPGSPSGGGSASSSSSSTEASGASGGSKASPPPLASQTPRAGMKLRSPDQIFRPSLGAFSARAPDVRAADRHSFSIDGSDCLSCHASNGGGTAPAFSFAGTIALGKKWVHAPPGWRPGDLPTQAGTKKKYGDYGYDDYDDYGDYDDCYDDYGDYGYDGYDDYGYDEDDYGYGSCRRKGWPEYRDEASPNTEVRMVGDDGKVFETVTDADGHFWFKSTAEVKQPAFTGVRKGQFQIAGASNGTACGSCHESKAPNSIGRIWTWDGPTPR